MPLVCLFQSPALRAPAFFNPNNTRQVLPLSGKLAAPTDCSAAQCRSERFPSLFRNKWERWIPPLPLIKLLLELHLTARFLELLLGRFCIGLGRAFQYRLGRTLDERLGVREAETGLHFAHGFDDGDLLVCR